MTAATRGPGNDSSAILIGRPDALAFSPWSAVPDECRLRLSRLLPRPEDDAGVFHIAGLPISRSRLGRIAQRTAQRRWTLALLDALAAGAKTWTTFSPALPHGLPSSSTSRRRLPAGMFRFRDALRVRVEPVVPPPASGEVARCAHDQRQTLSRRRVNERHPRRMDD